MNKLIAGNWKMNLNSSDAEKLAEGLKSVEGVEILVCPSFVNIPTVHGVLKDSEIKIGAQNVSEYEWGAYTGEVSVNQLSDFGINYVIVGHSERREFFCEDNEQINKKIKILQKHNITPILCVGEPEDVRKNKNEKEYVRTQVLNCIQDTDDNIVVAYEPIWAIGTGISANIEDVEEMSDFLREILEEHYSKKVRILYGGSVKPSNAKEILSLKNVDGALIGGASLVADDFMEILKYGK